MDFYISGSEWFALPVFVASTLASLWTLWLRNVIFPPASVPKQEANRQLRAKRDADTRVNGSLFLVLAACSGVITWMNATTNEVTRVEFASLEEAMTGFVSQEDFDRIMERVKKIEDILDLPGGGTGTVMEQIKEISDKLDAISGKLDGLDEKFVAKPEFDELREIVAMINRVVKRQALGNNRTLQQGR